jgi:sorting nexin-1/2
MIGDIHKKLFNIHEKQAKYDLHHLIIMIDEHERFIGSAKIAFNARAKAYSAYQSAENQRNKKQEIVEKLESTMRVRTDKIEMANSELSSVIT